MLVTIYLISPTCKNEVRVDSFSCISIPIVAYIFPSCVDSRSAFEFEGAKPFAAVRFDTEAAEPTSVAATATPDHMIKLVVKHL
jgi:hypothetical protein